VLIDANSLGSGATLTADVAVIGAGPAGIVTALELGKEGLDVLLVESGQETFEPEAQHLAEAAEWDHDLHSPMSITTRRQVGGTSKMWGGRCVPFDPVDFDDRPFVGPVRWPVGYDDLAPFFARTCSWMVCGRPVFDVRNIDHLPRSLVPGLPDGDVRTSTLERWSLPTDFGAVYQHQLRSSAAVRVVTGLTCTQVVCPEQSQLADHLDCRTLDGRRFEVRARKFVLACGGLESTRLLMASQGPQGGQLGNHAGHLGRWYMGHVEGVVANVRLATPPRDTIYGYERDVDGVYVRRRFSFTRRFQHARQLPNIVAWLANPELPDPKHRSGQLSFAYLALASPLGRHFAPDAQRLSLTGNVVPGAPYGKAGKGPVREHLKNVARDPWSTTRFILDFGAKRFLARRRRAPGFFAYRADNVYPLQFHGDHLPNAQSRVSLTRQRDALGMPRLKIDVRFSGGDVQGIIRAHRYWDEYLRRMEVGYLDYLDSDVEGTVWRQLGAGFHQSGSTRMSEHPGEGVVDRDLAVHGVTNVYVASSSAFPTSSQANSTFMIVAFAVRLSDHLAAALRNERSMSLP
jgi:hypothetical protein